jgi:hypothetical protein
MTGPPRQLAKQTSATESCRRSGVARAAAEYLKKFWPGLLRLWQPAGTQKTASLILRTEHSHEIEIAGELATALQGLPDSGAAVGRRT